MRRKRYKPDLDAQMYVHEITGRLDRMAETETLNLHQRLLEVQRAVTRLTKDGTSKGAGQFAYVSSSLVLGAVREEMDRLGLILTANVTEYTLHPNAAYEGKQHLTEVMMEFTWINVDKPDDRETFRFPGQGIDSGEKGIGKAATYAEKYFLLKFFHIATDKDDPDAGTPANGKAAPASAPATPPAATQTQAQPLHEDGVCPDCGKPLKRRKTKKDGSEFLACSGYERDGTGCNYTCNIDAEPAQPAAEAPADDQGEDIPQNITELRRWMTEKLGIAAEQHQATLDSLAGKTIIMGRLRIEDCTKAWLLLKAAHDAAPEGADEEPAADDNPFDDAPELPEYTPDNPPTLKQLRTFWDTVTGLGKAKHVEIAAEAGVDLTQELEPADCWELWESTWKLIRLDAEDRPEWVGAEAAA